MDVYAHDVSSSEEEIQTAALVRSKKNKKIKRDKKKNRKEKRKRTPVPEETLTDESGQIEDLSDAEDDPRAVIASGVSPTVRGLMELTVECNNKAGWIKSIAGVGRYVEKVLLGRMAANAVGQTTAQLLHTKLGPGMKRILQESTRPGLSKDLVASVLALNVINKMTGLNDRKNFLPVGLAAEPGARIMMSEWMMEAKEREEDADDAPLFTLFGLQANVKNIVFVAQKKSGHPDSIKGTTVRDVMNYVPALLEGLDGNTYLVARLPAPDKTDSDTEHAAICVPVIAVDDIAATSEEECAQIVKGLQGSLGISCPTLKFIRNRELFETNAGPGKVVWRTSRKINRNKRVVLDGVPLSAWIDIGGKTPHFPTQWPRATSYLLALPTDRLLPPANLSKKVFLALLKQVRAIGDDDASLIAVSEERPELTYAVAFLVFRTKHNIVWKLNNCPCVPMSVLNILKGVPAKNIAVFLMAAAKIPPYLWHKDVDADGVVNIKPSEKITWTNATMSQMAVLKWLNVNKVTVDSAGETLSVSNYFGGIKALCVEVEYAKRCGEEDEPYVASGNLSAIDPKTPFGKIMEAGLKKESLWSGFTCLYDIFDARQNMRAVAQCMAKAGDPIVKSRYKAAQTEYEDLYCKRKPAAPRAPKKKAAKESDEEAPPPKRATGEAGAAKKSKKPRAAKKPKLTMGEMDLAPSPKSPPKRKAEEAHPDEPSPKHDDALESAMAVSLLADVVANIDYGDMCDMTELQLDAEALRNAAIWDDN